jgi:glycosyltransferase involved in cell wall biosynthesis
LAHDQNALLVPPGSEEAAARALERLLEEPALAERLGRAALVTSERLTWDARARRILDFLAQRLATFGSAPGA